MNSISLTSLGEVFLLSTEEWEEAIASVPNVPIERNCWWWLRSPYSNSYRSCGVDRGGSADNYADVGCADTGVVPAFRISDLLSKYGVVPGDKVTVGAKTVCTVIADDVVLADNAVCKHRFDPDSNIWETSEIKTFINSKKFLKML